MPRKGLNTLLGGGGESPDPDERVYSSSAGPAATGKPPQTVLYSVVHYSIGDRGLANVFLSGEAYARLKAAKKAGESFSDVVMREVKQDLDLNEFLGCCKGMDVDAAIAKIKRERERG